MRRLPFVSMATLIVMGSMDAIAQQLPTLTVPAKGDTINMSIQNGSRSSLSFGSSTSFGSSANLTTTEGTSTSSSSTLAPASGSTLKFSIGFGSTLGTTSANVDNLRSQGSGPATISGSTIDAKDSTISSGVAELTGVQSQVDLTLDPQKTVFTSKTNTLHESYGATQGQDGAQLKSNTLSSNSTSQTSNASGSASISNNTNVDINSTTFTSVFLQAF